MTQELGVKVPEWDHIRSSHDSHHLRSRLPEPFALDKVTHRAPDVFQHNQEWPVLSNVALIGCMQ